MIGEVRKAAGSVSVAASVLLLGYVGVGAQGGLGAGVPTSVDFDDRTGFVQIFDGRTLDGWEGADVWRVADGTIVVENTPERPVGGTTFIFYRDTTIGDFELKLEMQVEGGGNSGIQYRSRNVEPDQNFGRGGGGGRAGGQAAAGRGAPTPSPAAPAQAAPQAAAVSNDPCAPGARGGGAGGRGQGQAMPGGGARQGGGPAGPVGGPYAKWNLQGYQFDTDADGCMAGQLFEGGRFAGERGITTRQGQVVLLREGQPSQLLGTVSTPEEIRRSFNRGDWNQYHIVVRGNTFMHILNGHLASVTVDDDTSKRQERGVIGIQIEGAQRVAFRNVWLKKL